MVVSSLYFLLKQHIRDHGLLPRKLHLNLGNVGRFKEMSNESRFPITDNCFRENKNRYLFAWLSNLVELSVFSEVSVSFLMKGHTGDIN